MLDTFEQRAAQLHQPLYDVYAMFLHSSRALLSGEYDEPSELADEAVAAGLEAHGPNAEVAYAGQLFCLAWDRGQLAELVPLVEEYAANAPRLPVWQVALAGYVRPRRACYEEARPIFERFVTADGLRLDDNPMFFTAAGFITETARWMDDPERAQCCSSHSPRTVTGRGHRARRCDDRAGQPLCRTGRLPRRRAR